MSKKITVPTTPKPTPKTPPRNIPAPKQSPPDRKGMPRRPTVKPPTKR
jgi:hypothetical protein